MRSWRRAHAAVVGTVVALVAAAAAQPAEVPRAGAADGSAGPPPKPAGSSPVESADLPDLAPAPAKFAVAPFENRSGVRAFDWLVAGAPFEIAEKTEAVIGLEATGGPLYVAATPVAPEPASVAAFAAGRGATWVITGWVERPNWELKLSVTLWRVTGQAASVAHEVTRRGPVPSYHALLGDALAEAWTATGKKLDAAATAKLARPLASDIYAVTLLGRGLGHFTGALSPERSHGAGGGEGVPRRAAEARRARSRARGVHRSEVLRGAARGGRAVQARRGARRRSQAPRPRRGEVRLRE